ncbi:hypothetical protein TNCV_4267541 [Trichonephila clavipes]|nr:hypothetical protein TNCV_4267541 [Trichonephila clavipes]
MRSGDLFLEVSSSKQGDSPYKTTKSLLTYTLPWLLIANLNFRVARDGQVLNTKHLILTFSTPDLPQTVKMAYIRCPVRPYIPIRCAAFSANDTAIRNPVCRGQPTCPRCGGTACCFVTHAVSGKSYASATRKSTSDKCIQCDSKKDISSVSSTPLNQRDFHRKIEEDTLTGDCSEDDEDLMDIQSGPSTSSSRGGASAAQ